MEKKINDFSFRVATVNGTGSQSANNILFKSLFRMGVGVCGKNLFPSNIQGLPTWFQIRVSEKGYQCLREHDDIAVLMNPETAKDDVAWMQPGKSLFYNSNLITIAPDQLKPGQNIYGIPIEELSKTINPELRHLLKNLFYVAALSHLYGIDKDVIGSVIADTFKSKQKAIDANLVAFNIGLDYAKANFEKKDGFMVEKREGANKGKIVIEGNSAAALGSIYGGCTFLAWYPITPSSSLAESVDSFAGKLRADGTGKSKFASIQAEDELSSIGMVIGASWAGARAMTSTSGPGISLMGEFIGLAYYAEVPAVIWDVQRVGPSTGLPTRTQQCDIQKAALASHGDTKHVLLFPSSPKECFEMAGTAFDLAERLQTPVFVMTDLDLGMNIWMDDEFQHQDKPFDRGKVLSAENLTRIEAFGRYQDVDNDGICYRTLPGTDSPKGSFFTRGSGHDEFARYTESPVVYTKNVDRLLRKWHTAKKYVPAPIITGDPKAKVGIIACGTSNPAVTETMDRMNNKGVKYLRLRAYPFTKEVEEFIGSCDQVFIVEQNRDGQLQQLLEIDIRGCQPKLKGVRYYGGFPLSADFIEREINEKAGK
ncbi:MAG: 2-oxoacid:acceptor oxidoreductase subunit alpha [Deltaproteobacteria bacterium]|nr:2-oxoacid:acceptor oxidoreductase subunit alpha [Deltaproteobacteria bacterium]MBI3296502.1 2-oxoacid:acceptor oxidoreductase subunit alpha [Deltaproteobacteria bacterium]